MSQNEKTYLQHGVAMTCRSYQEYIDMFQLTPADLARGRILDVAGGASSFAAEATRLGYDVSAVDPLYTRSPETIAAHGESERQEAGEKLSNLLDVYDWSYYGTLDHHEHIRQKSLSRFLEDYARPERRDRYVVSQLPNLPFADESFSLIVSSHFLFLYEEQFDFAFHLAAIRELIRLLVPGGEIRLYPVSTLARQPYSHLQELVSALSGGGTGGRPGDDGSGEIEIGLVDTSFRFLLSATQYLRIVRRTST